jgi:very-short-patch-repair endonuclease
MASKLEIEFSLLWIDLHPDIDLFAEYRFHPPRRFRFDFANLETKIAIEIQGGVWMKKSRHKTGSGLVKEYEKLNLAAADGWRVFLLCRDSIDEPNLNLIASAIKASLSACLK